MLRSAGIVAAVVCMALPYRPADCSAAELRGRVVASDGSGVAGAVVFLPDTDHAAVPGAPVRSAVMDQIDKQFVPHVLPIAVGTEVRFPNHDQIHHHVYSFSRVKSFDLPLSKGEEAAPVLFDAPGRREGGLQHPRLDDGRDPGRPDPGLRHHGRRRSVRSARRPGRRGRDRGLARGERDRARRRDATPDDRHGRSPEPTFTLAIRPERRGRRRTATEGIREARPGDRNGNASGDAMATRPGTHGSAGDAMSWWATSRLRTKIFVGFSAL